MRLFTSDHCLNSLQRNRCPMGVPVGLGPGFLLGRLRIGSVNHAYGRHGPIVARPWQALGTGKEAEKNGT